NKGAMIAMELVKNGNANEPDADLCKTLVDMANKNGLLILSCGLYGNVIRFLPALTIPEEIATEGLAILAECFEELVG
ncbi:MAG: 4-aminobutyrate aminotransferase/(S)-3-amino-2-methylpropionate transaminase, partial [Cocleimonas sp.]